LPSPSISPVGILGGTFDPIHTAHLRIAQLALDVLELKLVLWLPTGAPGYRAAPVAPAEDRVAMLRLALAGEPRYAIDTRELEPGASGYTVDTLVALRRRYGDALPLVLLIGGDQFAKLESWHRWRELFHLAHIAVFARPGWAPPQGEAGAELRSRSVPPHGDWRARPAGSIVAVDMPPIDVSATALRRAIAEGEDVSAALPPEVLHYISTHRLYRGVN
jgi:nicotinate-nucleotide adenylyltransferase